MKISDIKIGDYVFIKYNGQNNWLEMDARVGMNDKIPYKVIDLPGNDRPIGSTKIILRNPDGHENGLSYFQIHNLSRVATKEEYPEYYL